MAEHVILRTRAERVEYGFEKCLPYERAECIAALDDLRDKTESANVARLMDAIAGMLDKSRPLRPIL